VIAIASTGGVAWATGIRGADGVINDCYQKNQGQLRVIDPATDTCRPSEVAITWNQQGVRGEKGEKGEPGAPRHDGVDGRDGTGVSVEQEGPGPNCAAGGVKLTAANGVVYVCNAASPPPDPGEDYSTGMQL
jgi:hypothetical protein